MFHDGGRSGSCVSLLLLGSKNFSFYLHRSHSCPVFLPTSMYVKIYKKNFDAKKLMKMRPRFQNSPFVFLLGIK